MSEMSSTAPRPRCWACGKPDHGSVACSAVREALTVRVPRIVTRYADTGTYQMVEMQEESTS